MIVLLGDTHMGEAEFTGNERYKTVKMWNIYLTEVKTETFPFTYRLSPVDTHNTWAIVFWV